MAGSDYAQIESPPLFCTEFGHVRRQIIQVVNYLLNIYKFQEHRVYIQGGCGGDLFLKVSVHPTV